MTARVVALGGGHGLYHSLTALRELTPHLTAIVTVADDGGSSGRLREEMGIVPPGDLRMALSALCSDSEWGRTWRDVLQWRFRTDGPLHGHAMGNLLIAALWDRHDDVVEGLEWVGRLLQARGRVLPLSGEPLLISATVEEADGTRHEVSGQVAVATAAGRIVDVRLSPARPRVPEQTVAAMEAADLVVLGPGSWYTSVLAHFLVPDVREALEHASERAVMVLNVGNEDVETSGTTRTDDVRALQELAPRFRPAHVVVDATHADDPGLAEAIAEWGADLRVCAVRALGPAPAHDPVLLRENLAEIARERGLQVTVDRPSVAG